MFQNLNDPRRTQWRNSEDELLKAFVMKYGTNSWSRISCTLRYKTPNQCRERWNEYLNPVLQVRKWSPKDDENLLRLAKAFPNQWKTIATTLSRSAQQCLTRFDEIVYAETASHSVGGILGSPFDASAPNELVESGVVYPHTQPPNADATTLDQDEVIALKEGYSRLANVQNKKERTRLKKAVQEHNHSKIKLRRYRDLQRAGLIDKDNDFSSIGDNGSDDTTKKPSSAPINISNETSREGTSRVQVMVDASNHANTKLTSFRSHESNYDSCTFNLNYEECKALGTVFPTEPTFW
ncbi:SANT/Myb domain containing protein [Perkinsela sp. CCAP 1560/4]|nr:SANT/Myb domain containing protein [Perkinsela sp. CCAP 1560/4]|eukprot:KNH08881.1 SANT/Myb domain containing protein [Perkinsela sp. CCAP 1560/4]